MDNTSDIIHNTSMPVKLSIVVPIYNVEAYLRKCVDSLLAQDYSDYEIILVDDGSTDNCPAICDEYASPSFVNSLTRSVVIKVLHQANAGLSAARNSGIMAANGDYIMFVDSDDYIEPNVLVGLMAQIERDNLDVLRYKYQYVDAEGNPYNPYKSGSYKGHDYSSKVTDGITFLNTRFGTSCYAWQFILRRDLIFSQLSALDSPLSTNNSQLSALDSCLFTPGIYFEDTDWTPRMLCHAKRVASTDTIVYNYLLSRQGSITNAVNRSKQKKVLDDKMRLIGEMLRQSNELKQKGLCYMWFERMIADTVISIVGILSSHFYNEKKEYIERLKKNDVFPIKSKSIKARFINMSPRLAVELLHLKNSH